MKPVEHNSQTKVVNSPATHMKLHMQRDPQCPSDFQPAFKTPTLAPNTAERA